MRRARTHSAARPARFCTGPGVMGYGLRGILMCLCGLLMRTFCASQTWWVLTVPYLVWTRHCMAVSHRTKTRGPPTLPKRSNARHAPKPCSTTNAPQRRVMPCRKSRSEMRMSRNPDPVLPRKVDQKCTCSKCARPCSMPTPGNVKVHVLICSANYAFVKCKNHGFEVSMFTTMVHHSK